jgi:hypothetical protein
LQVDCQIFRTYWIDGIKGRGHKKAIQTSKKQK